MSPPVVHTAHIRIPSRSSRHCDSPGQWRSTYLIWMTGPAIDTCRQSDTLYHSSHLPLHCMSGPKTMLALVCASTQHLPFAPGPVATAGAHRTIEAFVSTIVQFEVERFGCCRCWYYCCCGRGRITSRSDSASFGRELSFGPRTDGEFDRSTLCLLSWKVLVSKPCWVCIALLWSIDNLQDFIWNPWAHRTCGHYYRFHGQTIADSKSVLVLTWSWNIIG